MKHLGTEPKARKSAERKLSAQESKTLAQTSHTNINGDNDIGNNSNDINLQHQDHRTSAACMSKVQEHVAANRLGCNKRHHC